MDLAAVAAELYGLPLGEFTTARNERAKAARSEANSLVAKHIGRLPKPSAAAWAVNMLARHRAPTMQELVDLGASLRKAQADRDPEALRALGQQRQKVLAAVVRDARAVAAELGAGVSDAAAADIEQTLRAAMADPDAAVAAASGQLVRALSSNGIEPVDLAGAVAVPRALPRIEPEETGEKPGGEAEEESAEARRAAQLAARDHAQAELHEAERDAEQAEAALAEVERHVSDALSRKRDLSAELSELRDRVAELEEELTTVKREAFDAEHSRKFAARLADQKRRAADRARERLEGLPDR